MPKLSAKTRSTGTAVQPSFVQMSHEEPFEQSLIGVILGQIGVGKTTLAASASKFFPSTLPEAKHRGKPKYILKDMAWCSFDAKATAGFAERGISVPNFDIPHFMGSKEKWSKAGFKRAPNVFQAATFGINALLQNSPDFLVIDTISMFDMMLKHYWQHYVDGADISEKRKTFVLYDSMLKSHTDFYTQCTSLGCAVLFLCHTKAPSESDDKTQKAKQTVLTTAEGGEIVPAITGQAQRLYKAPASFQFAVLAQPKLKGGRKVLERYVSPIKTAGHETKNRWEASLSDREEAHLGKIFKKIKG